MLIDMPLCNFKNCRYCFDGNCTNKVKCEVCEYAKLLKQQEPRLLALEEAMSIGRTSCWMQIRSGEIWLAQVHPTINGNVSIKRLGQKDCIEEKQDYGKRWVCWSDQPTKEQRKAVKWDD